MDTINQMAEILLQWLHGVKVTVPGVFIGVIIMILSGITLHLDRQEDSKKVGTIKALTMVLIAAFYSAATTGFFEVTGSILRLIGGWMIPVMVIVGIFLAWLMRKYRSVQVIFTVAVGIAILLSWNGMSNKQEKSNSDTSSAVTQVQTPAPKQDPQVTELRRQLAGIVDSSQDEEVKPSDRKDRGFVQGDFDFSEVVRILIILIIILAASLRLYEAFAGVVVDGRRVCKMQWLVTLSPQTKKPETYDFMSGDLVFFWVPTLLFGVFNLLLTASIAVPRFMFHQWWGYLVLPLVFLGLYFYSSMIKLQTAHKLVYELGGDDVYKPIFYLWRKELGQGTLYCGELLSKLYRGDGIIDYKYQRGYRKGIHFSILSVWLSSSLVRAYIFKEETLEIDTFWSDYYATSKLEWPDTNRFDGMYSDGFKNVGEPGSEVRIKVNLTLWRYVDPEPFLPMADQDRADEEGWIKRKFIDPLLALFFSRGTMNQFVGAGMMRSPNFRVQIGGQSLNFIEELRNKLRPFGYDAQKVEFGDCNPSEKMIQAQDKLAELENQVKQAKMLADAVREESKGAGDALLNTLTPLLRAIEANPGQISMAMAYNAQLALYQSQNRIIAVAPDMQGTIQQLLKSLQGITGINPALNPPTTP